MFGIDQIKQILDLIDGFLGGALWFPFLLLGVGIFFTIYLGVPQVRFFGRAWRIFLGKEDSGTAPGDTSHFQALSTALSGTVGTGNVAGVAFALFIGGPAALLWMWVTAFLGMTTKFVEVTLAHKYREQDEHGEMNGGAWYFLEKRLNMKWLAVIFAVATVICVFGTGNLPQSNSMASGMESSFGIPGWVTSGLMALLLALVIIGGIKRIAQVTSILVPFMAFLYGIGAVVVLIQNYSTIPEAFGMIFASAFSGSAAVGGFLGAGFAYAFTKGVGRGLFSNEAGQGSAPIAHASAKADHPIPEGLVSLLEPFIDTLCICTLTGLVILSTGVWMDKFDQSFVHGDMEIVAGVYNESSAEDTMQLAEHLNEFSGPENDEVDVFSGKLRVENGNIVSTTPITILHSRSIAEDVQINLAGEPFTGVLNVTDGAVDSDFEFTGKSLLHSVPLTQEAFRTSILGDVGADLVAIGLLLFAFSTAIAWSYYGDRAITYLFGTKLVLPYRIIYCIVFFSAAFIDTSVVWKLAAIFIVLMAVPNLLGITLLAKEMKATLKDFGEKSE